MAETPVDTATEVRLLCPHCGYDLRGLPENRCPECGRVFQPERMWCDDQAPLRIRGLLLRAGWLPLVVVLFPLAFRWLEPTEILIAVMTATPLLIFSLVYLFAGSIRVARCWRLGRERRAGGVILRELGPWSDILIGIALFCLLMGLGMVGCTVVAANLMYY